MWQAAEKEVGGGAQGRVATPGLVPAGPAHGAPVLASRSLTPGVLIKVCGVLRGTPCALLPAGACDAVCSLVEESVLHQPDACFFLHLSQLVKAGVAWCYCGPDNSPAAGRPRQLTHARTQPRPYVKALSPPT